MIAPETTMDPMPSRKNDHGPDSTCAIDQSKFIPKNPVRKLSGRKIEAMIASCFDVSPCRFATVDR